MTQHLAAAKERSQAVFYWLQTEAPRPDGGAGFPGLRLRGDLLGSTDGLLGEFQSRLVADGVELGWPDVTGY